MSVRENAYAAGLFDGEGCVLFYHTPIRKSFSRVTTSLQVSNCDRRCLEFLQTRYGGFIRKTEKRSGEGKRYPIGTWSVTGQEAENFARAILPYSILKREQLELFLEGRKLIVGRGGTVTPTMHKKRLEIAKRIKSLKRPQWTESYVG